MLKNACNYELYPEWLEYIDAEETKDAFRYLVGFASGLKDFICHLQLKGFKGPVKVFHFFNKNDEGQFAFIINKKWLLFYFRLSAIRSGKYSLQVLRKAFDSVEENNSGEWTVKLRSIEDARHLSQLLRLV